VKDGHVLCVGEPIVALTPTAGGTLRDADDLVISVGGAEVNVAVQLARLGIPTRFAGRVGDDAFGHRIVDALAVAGVDTEFLEVDPERPTGLYLKDRAGPVRCYRRGSAAAAHRSIPAAALIGVGHIHLSGITPALSADCAHLVQTLLAPDRHVTVSFDVNFRPGLWDAAMAGPVLARLASLADLVFVGLDEAAPLWGVATPDELRELLAEATELVVKNGPETATAFRHDQRIEIAPPPVTVVDPVGAGDAFAAGYLAERRRGGGLAEALRRAHLLAGAALTTLHDHHPAQSPRPSTISRDEVIARIGQCRLVPVLRLPSAVAAADAATRCFEAELDVVELTATTPGWFEALTRLRADHPDRLIGLGTVFEPADARRAVDAGANFVVTPCAAPAVRAEIGTEVLMIEGGLTVGEILAAARHGPAKLFPAHVGGPAFLRSIKAVAPHAVIIPTGGIPVDEVSAWLAAGAFAVGVGTDLTNRQDIGAAVRAVLEVTR